MSVEPVRPLSEPPEDSPQGGARLTPSAEPVIRAKNLTMVFGSQTAVDHINLQIPPGQIFGYIGPSGSGKTTTIRLLTGLYQPTAGTVTIFGHPPSKFSLKERERIGYMPQSFVLYPSLTVRENMGFAASVYGLSRGRARRIAELLDMVELTPHRNKLAQNISGGMQRRLSLAAALVHRPDLLFLDEPTASVDPLLRQKFWEYFHTLRDEGVSMFITTQYVTEAAYCDLVGVMNEGRLILVDTPAGLRHAAYGGDIITITTGKPVDYLRLQDLNRQSFVVKNVEISAEKEFRVTVRDAAVDLPVLLDWSQRNELETTSVEQYLPAFDEVFVSLIKDNNGNV